MRALALGLGLALIGLEGVGHTQAQPAVAVTDGKQQAGSAVAWLMRMSQALTQLEYEGTLVYLHGHQLSTLRIAHRIENGQPRESLLALSGPIRAVARSDQQVTCVLPDAHAISVPRHVPHATAPLRPELPNIERLQPHYLIHALGRSRVAGRDTQVIGIIPRDDWRYGYRFFIDEATGLPLKTDLMDSAATPIEQVMFTEVDFFDREPGRPARAPVPMPERARGNAVNAEGKHDRSARPIPGLEAGDWAFARLPAGYRVEAGDSVPIEGQQERRWFMISDGLSAVSVYIEPDHGRGLAGTKHIGAVNAAGRALDGHQITVVGEATLRTVQAIADAVSLAQP